MLPSVPRFTAKTRAGEPKAVLSWAGKHAQHATSLRLLGHDKGASVPFCPLPLPGLRCLTVEVTGELQSQIWGRACRVGSLNHRWL